MISRRSTLQRYFSGLAGERVAHPSILKIRDTLSSILRSAVRYGFLVQNPMVGLKLPVDKRPRRQKPVISPEQFSNLVEYVPEPYASMLFVSVWTGLRISELIGLKWRCVHADSITVEERYCRGDWSTPKTNASAATIGVAPEVIARIHRLKSLTVKVRAGRRRVAIQVVKSAAPDDLVFQIGQRRKPMSDQNILKRHIQPVARRLGLNFVDWRCLRRSYATWLVQSGADPKSVQGQMRHSRVSTSLDIYAQVVPVSQRRAVEKLSEFANEACHTLSQKRPISVLKTGVMSSRINQMIAGERIVRNDEVVGSIPTSSTNFSITCSHSSTESCPNLSQKIHACLARVCLKKYDFTYRIRL